MTEQEFLDLGYLSHAACEGAVYDDNGFLILTLGITKADRIPDRSSETRIQFVLGHDSAQRLSRALANAIRGVPTIA